MASTQDDAENQDPPVTRRERLDAWFLKYCPGVRSVFTRETCNCCIGLCSCSLVKGFLVWVITVASLFIGPGSTPKKEFIQLSRMWQMGLGLSAVSICSLGSQYLSAPGGSVNFRDSTEMCRGLFVLSTAFGVVSCFGSSLLMDIIQHHDLDEATSSLPKRFAAAHLLLATSTWISAAFMLSSLSVWLVAEDGVTRHSWALSYFFWVFLGVTFVVLVIAASKKRQIREEKGKGKELRRTF